MPACSGTSPSTTNRLVSRAVVCATSWASKDAVPGVDLVSDVVLWSMHVTCISSVARGQCASVLAIDLIISE